MFDGFQGSTHPNTEISKEELVAVFRGFGVSPQQVQVGFKSVKKPCFGKGHINNI